MRKNSQLSKKKGHKVNKELKNVNRLLKRVDNNNNNIELLF